MTIAVTALFAGITTLLILAIRTWSHPAVLVMTVWSILCTLPLVFAPTYAASAAATAWIAVSCVIAAGAAFLTSGPRKLAEHHRPRATASCGSLYLPGLATIVVILTILGTLEVFVLVANAGIDPTAIGTAQDVAVTANRLSVLRYSGFFVNSSLGQVLLVCVTLLFLCAGMLHAAAVNRREKLLACLAFVPAVLSFLLQSTRTSLLYAGIFWWAARTATNLCRRRPSHLVSARGLALAMLLAAAAPFAVGIGDELRAGTVPGLDQVAMSINSARTRSAIFAHVGPFSQWFERNFPDVGPLTYGRYTFSGPLQLVGMNKDRTTGGLYDGSELLDSGESTNIYTLFRGVLQDFGVVGALLFMMLFGAVAGWAYRSVWQGRQALISVLACCYAFILWYVVSIVEYTSVSCAFILFGLYCAVTSRLKGTGTAAALRQAGLRHERTAVRHYGPTVAKGGLRCGCF